MTSDLAAHLEGLRTALAAMVRYADRAGLSAPVPTTPDWTVRRLVAHQGMVHRWAAAIIRGDDVDQAGAAAAFEAEGRSTPDPLEWLRDGAIELVTAICRAPDDLDALVFLADAPPPKRFWARRQCHETTIHAVDALSAQLGRYPVAADAGWIPPELALDGIDELLSGFLPRPVSRLRSEDPQRIVVLPEEGDTAWQVDVSTAPPVTTRLPRRDAPSDADTLLAGGAVGLYLTLWNRSDEVAPTGDWDLWRDSAQVRWTR
ncbi:maleylpyruvate isomerase family mycothiol-dependent enzyme [Nocardioides gansuensis]|uniref:Maleylpyruvate isomerase family mycothiol-dependent enzyme n=1 Tax=Nocardioides gansuensis TaxID=2138300 RepID=A0A2T8F953_9ACTN|nr:maleylpyruvate isomerase family mycothiol-dependent enzyme [Nocardioides gansuensis]PVG82261.1 maleylpyruvate isomerase family mycothiol-dependent enzyme [Nocardioides gansuensis]